MARPPKADRTTTTLNPNVVDSFALPSDYARIRLDTNLPGYDLYSRVADLKITVVPVGKAPADNLRAVTIVDPSTRAVYLNVFFLPTTPAYGASYKVQLVLPRAYQAAKTQQMLDTAPLTITVKIGKQSTGSAGQSGYAGPTVKLSPSGKVDLTTGAGAVVKATFTNFDGMFQNNLPAFVVTYPDGTQPLLSDTPFIATPTGPNAWKLTADPAKLETAPLAAGTYKLDIAYSALAKTYSPLAAIAGAGAQTTQSVNFTVTASAPKAALSAKAVTLQGNDKYSTAVVRITLPANATLPLDTTRMVNTFNQGNGPFTLVSLGDGKFLVGYRPPTNGWTAPKTANIKIPVFLVGDATKDTKGADKPVTSLTLKVNVAK